MANTMSAMAKPSVSPLAALNLGELSDIAEALQPMVGAQLQECLHANREIGLGFYHRGEMSWLWFDLDPKRPMVIRVGSKPPPRKKAMRPFALFVRSRFLGRRLSGVRCDLARGRVLVLSFYRAESEQTTALIEIEVLLLPHAPNLIARDGSTVVAENKPKDLPLVSFSLPPAEERRTWQEIELAWMESKSPKRSDPAAAEREWSRAVEKKREALVKMQGELELKSQNPSRELGEWLKANGTLSVPAQWADLIAAEKSLAWNIENAFRVAKEIERKAEGARLRIEKVRAELAALETKGPTLASQWVRESSTSASDSQKSLLARADARGRSLKLAPDLDCYIGKSAADNLAILRRAQPFDLWLHLRESPGSHAIIRRVRGRVVTDAELLVAARWVAAQTFGKRTNDMSGQRFDLLIVECRFVKPIKGDKLGRVNYTNDRVMRFTL